MVIDDHILLAIMMDVLPGELSYLVEDGILTTDLYTTNHAYYRLLNSLSSGATTGSFSGKLATLPEEIQRYVVNTVARLPPGIQIVPMRDLIPVMVTFFGVGVQGVARQEPLAAAVKLQTGILVAKENEGKGIAEAARQLGIPFETVEIDWQVD